MRQRSRPLSIAIQVSRRAALVRNLNRRLNFLVSIVASPVKVKLKMCLLLAEFASYDLKGS